MYISNLFDKLVRVKSSMELIDSVGFIYTTLYFFNFFKSFLDLENNISLGFNYILYINGPGLEREPL